MSGPLTGYRIIEIAGIGPGPFAAMLLADIGAEVMRVDRAQAVRGGDPERPPLDVLGRGRRSIGVDLKHPDGVEAVLRLVRAAPTRCIEGFRPGVIERLGLGPDELPRPQPQARLRPHDRVGPGRARTPQAAGHDINYIALAGALRRTSGAPASKPIPPLNLVGDFGGGGMLLAFGMVCALLEAQRAGRGPGGRRRDGRRRRGAHEHVPRHAGDRHVARRARHQPARHRRALLRHLRDRRRQVRLDRLRSSRSSTPSSCGCAGLAEDEDFAAQHGPRRSGPR